MAVKESAFDIDVEKGPTVQCLAQCKIIERCNSPESKADSDSSWPDSLSWKRSSQEKVQRLQSVRQSEYSSTCQKLADVVTAYGCLLCIVLVANGSILLWTVCTLDPSQPLWSQNAATPVAVNLLIALLARNEHFVNALFHVACIKPTSAPFYVRAALSHVHSYGGLHSGCAISAALWYILKTTLVTISVITLQVDVLCAAISWSILMLLASVILLALPQVRMVMHDWFEVTHRFAGWSIVMLVWIELFVESSVVSDATGTAIGNVLTASPTLWCLISITLLVVYPWLRIRKRQCSVSALSDHAVQLHFEGNAGPCTTVKLSNNPLRENHPFACIPEQNNAKAFSVIVSSAGDWTSQLVKAPPASIWMRETPQRGVLWVATMFSPVVIVATGSGIGPCLGLFNGCPDLQCRVLWSTRRPVATYGSSVLASVRRADSDAVIIDTDQHGRPDLGAEAEKLYREAKAEAVIVISNRKLTYEIVRYLHRRGICARGPIWDS